MTPTRSIVDADPIWEEALIRMKGRIDQTIRSALPGFPHYADPNTGQWVTSADGFWTGGFWLGELWLGGHYWNDPVYSRAAEVWLRRLSPRIDSKSVFRGFLFYYGAVPGAQLANSTYAYEIAVRSGQVLAKAFNPTVGLIPLGVEAEEAHKVGDNESNIDSIIASPLLLWTANATHEANLRAIALAHADRNAEFCVQADGSVIQSASFDPVSGQATRRYTHKGSSPSSIWTRAQAWAMLGYSLCAMLAPEEKRLLAIADQVAEWWINNIPADRVAYWDFSVPKTADTKRDTSGTAIAAASLLKLSAIHPDLDKASRYAQVAQDTVRALIQRHLTPTGVQDQRQLGILTDGCFDSNNRVAVANELIWGDYFLFEALGVLSGRLNASVL
jgi:unsaturated chondroitin disaccharide hydrolase